MKRAIAGLVAAAVVIFAGCSNVPYYWQAANGQLELWRKARPIDAWLADAQTSAELKARLRKVQEIRAFATRELALPDNGSYRSYAALDRPYVVWNVFTAPELSLEPKQWCFPVAGCVAYRGYFNESAARDFAAGLTRDGYDTYVGGVPAYSTLGWFDDPVPSTIIRYPETEVARLIFHELAHQVLYVKDDTTFNESFATAVEQEGVTRWVQSIGSPEQLVQFERAQSRKRAFVALVLEYQTRLARTYASTDTDDEKRAQKSRLQHSMREDYQKLKQSWGGASGYDAWFAGPLNNAQIASVASYTEQVPGFRALLAREQGDMKRFFAAAKELAQLPKAEREAKLAALNSASTAAAR